MHTTDEKFSGVSAMEHSDQQLQLYAMTEGSCFTILTEICKMVVVQMAHIRSKSHVTSCMTALEVAMQYVRVSFHNCV